jgi:hypothetical protein
MSTVRIYADFHNADPEGRLRLNCVETIEDLSRYQVELRDGKNWFCTVKNYKPMGWWNIRRVKKLWVAAIDWQQIRELDIASMSDVAG